MQLLGKHLEIQFTKHYYFLVKERLKHRNVYIAGSAYDRAAIKFRGVEADINFSLEDYEEDLKQVFTTHDCK